MASTKNPAEMSFPEFAEAMKPSGAVNRFPAIGVGLDVYSYSVYMNGPMTKLLPEHVLEHSFKDVMVTALTEKLGLNPNVARDNLKVAEIVALRSTWMSAVLESSTGLAPSSEVISDYEKLTDGLSHPWIMGELDKQKALGSKLAPSMAKAGVVKDVVPRETSVGQVVAQDFDFTFQQTSEGEIVTHENRRLAEMPAVGADVTVSYYRGTGQVVNSLDRLKVSPPFIDAARDDLAIFVNEGSGSAQVVLFNSMASFNKFVKAHGMDQDLVRLAMDAREASPKVALPAPKRELLTRPYIDEKSGCLAVDYKEKGMTFTALFRNAQEMSALAGEFDLGAKAVAFSRTLEVGAGLGSSVFGDAASQRVNDANAIHDLKVQVSGLGRGYSVLNESGDGVSYIGKVIAGNSTHVAQSCGRDGVVIHDLRKLDKVVGVGDNMTVKFEGGRGRVTNTERSGVNLGR